MALAGGRRTIRVAARGRRRPWTDGREGQWRWATMAGVVLARPQVRSTRRNTHALSLARTSAARIPTTHLAQQSKAANERGLSLLQPVLISSHIGQSPSTLRIHHADAVPPRPPIADRSFSQHCLRRASRRAGRWSSPLSFTSPAAEHTLLGDSFRSSDGRHTDEQGSSAHPLAAGLVQDKCMRSPSLGAWSLVRSTSLFL